MKKIRRRYDRDVKISVLTELEAGKLLAQRPANMASIRVFLARWKAELVENSEQSKHIQPYASMERLCRNKSISIDIYSIDKATMDMAITLSSRFGLLISDATHVAIMKAQGIANIATNDRDFGRVNGIVIYKP